MNRRFFLKDAMPISVFSSLLLTGGLKSILLKSHPFSATPSQKVLVLIHLDGGNDGLNTIIPLDQYSSLSQVRKNILIPEKNVLSLHAATFTGLHPAMTDLQQLYQDKKLTIIQGVGYKNPDLSHFRAIDIWHSGSSIDTVSTGWLGRYLDAEQQILSSIQNDDPSAIQLGSALTKNLQGSTMNRGMVVNNIDSFYNLMPCHYSSVEQSRIGKQLSFLHTTGIQSAKYLQRVKVATQKQKTLSKLYPSHNNPLADQLKIVARCIGGGLQTKVYIVNLKGFDTHSGQVDKADPTKGFHADLLSKLSSAIAAFEDDLSLMGKQENVLGMTFSEFGRRIKSNDSYGCDHGTSGPVILFGSKLKGGLIGQNPVINSNVDVNDNLEFQTDFRSIYASILKRWFDLPESKIPSTLLGQYAELDLFRH